MVRLEILEKLTMSSDKTAVSMHIMPQLRKKDRMDYFQELGIIIEYTSRGIPIIRSPESLFVSIAHTNNLEVVTLAHYPNGVDIESSTRQIDPLLCTFMDSVPSKALFLWLEAEAYCKISQKPIRTVLKNPHLYDAFCIHHILYQGYQICLIGSALTKKIMFSSHPSMILSSHDLKLTHI